MSEAARTDGPAPLPDHFEDAMTELEALVGQMESGRLPLEDALTAYERGVALVRHCRERLAVVTQQVQVLEAGLLVPYEVPEEAGSEAGETSGEDEA